MTQLYFLKPTEASKAEKQAFTQLVGFSIMTPTYASLGIDRLRLLEPESAFAAGAGTKEIIG